MHTIEEKHTKDSWDDEDNVSIHYFLHEYTKKDEEDK